jgi:diaminopimelate dehydrogenase
MPQKARRMKRTRLAIIGFGRLGRACAAALHQSHDLELAGVVTHTQAGAALAQPFKHVSISGHVRELKGVEAALVCVPAERVLGVAREILQQRLPVIECAILAGPALEAHYAALDEAARRHRVAAVVGAGWDPGVLPLVRRLFEVLIPRGRTQSGTHPGLSLHHTAAVEQVPGVKAALACESRAADGRLQHYLYLQLDKGASLEKVEEAIRADPLYAGEETLVFRVEDLAAFEAAGSGIVLERLGSAGTGDAGSHRRLLLEARFDVVAFAASVMLDAARRLPQLETGAHPYSLWP